MNVHKEVTDTKNPDTNNVYVYTVYSVQKRSLISLPLRPALLDTYAPRQLLARPLLHCFQKCFLEAERSSDVKYKRYVA